MNRYFALIGENDEIKNVIVADPDFIATLEGEWIEVGGKTNIRYCGKGDIYSRKHKQVHEKQPHKSWVLDENCIWQPPKKYPKDDNIYDWDEKKKDWVLNEEQTNEYKKKEKNNSNNRSR